jgi:hypothetical protein
MSLACRCGVALETAAIWHVPGTHTLRWRWGGFTVDAQPALPARKTQATASKNPKPLQRVRKNVKHLLSAEALKGTSGLESKRLPVSGVMNQKRVARRDTEKIVVHEMFLQ